MTKNYERACGCECDQTPPASMTSEEWAAREGIERIRVAQALARVREDLIHGFHPRREDLVDLWREYSGESITFGRRCDKCDGDGRARYGNDSSDVQKEAAGEEQPCRACGGLGWDVLPTAWERISDDRD